MPVTRLRARLFVHALAVSIAAIPSSALSAPAAEDPDPDFSLEETVQAGPFHLAPFLVIKDFGYDDNVRLGSEDPSGDYTLTVGPGARAVVPFGRRAALAIREEIDYSMFAREADLNHVNNELRSKLHVYLRDVTFFAHGESLSARERPNNEIDFRIRTVTTAGRTGVTWRPEARGSIELFARLNDYAYDSGRPEAPADIDPNNLSEIGDSIARSLQRDESSLGLHARLKIRPRTSFLLEVEQGGVDFDRRAPVDVDKDPNVTVIRNFSRDSRSRSVLAGLEFDPSGPVRGYLKLGRKSLEPDRDDRFRNFHEWIGDAAVSVRVLGRGDIKATLERDTVYSTFGDNLYFIEAQAGLAYEHHVSNRASLEIGRRVSDIDYPVPIFSRIEKDRRDDITHDTVSFRYRVGPGLRVGLSVGRWERDSTFDDEDAKRNTVATLLEYVP